MEIDNITPLKRTFSDMNNAPESGPPDTVSPTNGLDHQQQQEDQLSPSNLTGDFVPRSYQVKIFEVAMKRNTIAVLETGAGKTLIAVMLIREIAKAIKSSEEKKLIIFLAPTVHLVKQQYQFTKVQSNLEVGEYYGAKRVDEWTLKCWEKEIEEHDVLVMTPQILLDALRKAFLNLDMVSLLIIDECHRATSNHPYAKIMKEFYHKLDIKPKVFGMTASPVVRKGFSSTMDCEDQMSELESMLDSQIYTIKDRTELEVYVNSTRETCRFYDKALFQGSELKARIQASWDKFDASLLNLRALVQLSYKDLDDKLNNARKQLANDQANILSCLEDLGLFCAYEAVKICLKSANDPNSECEVYREISLQCKHFFEEVLHIIEGLLPPGDSFYGDFGVDFLKAMDLGYISPKLHELLQLFLLFGESSQVLCLIFVDRIITARVLETFVKKVALLAHFSVTYLTGTSTSADALGTKSQKGTLELFRYGKVNLLFATDVLEEGLDMPNCSCVIRFDLPKTVRSYVQSRGRARQNDSQYVIMLERGNSKQRDQIYDIIRSEWSMNDMAAGRDPDMWTLKACNTGETEGYMVDVTGASITADSSVSRLYQYCEKLPGDKYYTPRPMFEFEYFEHSCQCRIKLPSSAAVQMIVGPSSRSKSLAKQLACLEACKKLHQVGALNDHLLPSVEEGVENEPTVRSKEKSAGAGTMKRKELHGTTQIHALSGSWGDKQDGMTFHGYKFNFDCNSTRDVYSAYVLLIECKLDDDVGNFDADLYLLAKMVKASVSFVGQVHLDAVQMMKAKHFHELFFNGLFGKLYTGSKQARTPREFLLWNETRSLWSSSNMYLLLPLEMPGTSSDAPWKIDWMPVDASSSAVEFLRHRTPLFSAHMDSKKGRSSPCTVDSSVTESTAADRLHFANIAVDINSPLGMVVLAMHTGRIYVVIEVMSSMSAESPFEWKADAEPSSYSTYAEYYNKKYAIVLKNPGQPLLKLKQSHNPHNLLVNFNDEAGAKDGIVQKQRQYVHMPPELLVYMDIPSHVLKSFYLFPSLMQRLESLMLASQLREEIDCCAPNFHISSSLILEAITTLRCCESFSMERLELLGDSVLKYAVSCHLFLMYPKYHEGQLSTRRIQAVRNETLHKLGTARKVQGYIRDCPFEPLQWVAPGQKSKFPNSRKCMCGLDTLEVPLDAKFLSEDPSIKLGKSCEKGHRWMGSKTIADCVEAIIGAYYASGGMVAALHVMNWFGIDAQVDPSLVTEVITSASLRSYTPKEDEVKSLELKLGYAFSVKFLLQEAMTHASMQEQGVGYCYERLEFLGDSVLDLLITWHMYQSHIDVDPGELTDLRTASVNNENFVQVAVRQGLYGHLQHCSILLQGQIMDYVKSFSESNGLTEKVQGPKALGDLVESIAGAILIDTELDLDVVWRIFKPLLSPIVTPQELQLPPFRALSQLCDSLGYFIKEKCLDDGNKVQLIVQLDDVRLVGEGCDTKKKTAKAKAATHLLKELEKRGMAYSRDGSKRKQDPDDVVNSISLELTNDNHKKQKKLENPLPAEPNRDPPGIGSPIQGPPVIESINMKKGGPRVTIFELCKKLQWPRPTFETAEHKSRTPIEFDDGNEKRTGFCSFESTISLNIPRHPVLKCTGAPRADKKGSFDSAALCLLYQLQDKGLLIIGE